MRTRLLRTVLVCSAIALPTAGCSTFAVRCKSMERDARPVPLRVPGGEGLAAAVAAARVVYAGELHDDRAQHAFQLELLKALVADARRHGATPMLGMEMFQRPFQQPLDDYVAGRIDEVEMLRRTEYFDRWRYDHTFYAPLWQFCRENGVRVVALNVEKTVISQVGKGGVASLSPEQRAQIADEIDLDVPAHKERIVGVFQAVHPMPEERLRPMYEAMTTWDETMAESAARALRAAGPDSRMLIVVGAEHVRTGTGIPDRVARRIPGIPRALVIMNTQGRGESAPDEGDFVVTLAPVPDAPPAKLGVSLANEPDPAGLRVLGVAHGGNAFRAGVLGGDVLTHVSGRRVTDMVDLRFVLDRARIGTVVPVRVLRDGAQVELSVTLEPQAETPQG